MNYNFRKITASDTSFKRTKSENIKLHDLFKSFVSTTTNSKESGKIGSYPLYLIRIIMIYNEKNEIKITDSSNYMELYQLFNVTLDSNFSYYNLSEHRFPNATLESLKLFLFNFSDGEIFENMNLVKNDEHDDSLAKKAKIRSIISIPRDTDVVIGAKKAADFKCGFNPSHITFETTTKSNYIEAHHLIPLSYQSEFEHNLDIEENIICLCPTCHRKIHYSLPNLRKQLVTILFDQRKDKLIANSIPITYKNILLYYGIQ